MVMIDVTVTKPRLWCAVILVVMMMLEVTCLNGPNVCMVQQKYNITKRVKYRAPMSVRTYEWCFSMPPRCSKWKTEMRELTKLETDERIAEVAVCCPGYKMKDISCVPICPDGKTGYRCSDDCPLYKWGPNCVNDCEPCKSGICSPITGDCSCQDGWQGESCEIRMPSSTSTTTAEDILTKSATKTTPPIAPTIPSTRPDSVVTTSLPLQTTRTILIINTTSLSTHKPMLETFASESNRTVLLKTFSPVSSKEPSLNTSSMSRKITSVESRSTTTTTMKPISTVKTTTLTTSPVTTTMISRVTTPMTSTSTTLKVSSESTTMIPPVKLVVTTAATTLPFTTTAESDTTLTISEDKATEEMKTAQTNEPTTLTAVQTTENLMNIDKIITTTELSKSATFKSNWLSKNITTQIPKHVKEITRKMELYSKYNETGVSIVPEITHELQIPVKVSLEKFEMTKTFNNITNSTYTTSVLATEGTTKIGATKRPQSTIRYFPTTVKFKPKEIWIRPAQKGESFMKIKTETNHDLHSKPNAATQLNTTPKTIIVSIIPTSVSYATFKKIALTTASLLSQKINRTLLAPSETAEQEVTKPMSTLTTTELPITTKISIMNVTQKLYTTSKLIKTMEPHSTEFEQHIDNTTETVSTFHTTREFSRNKTDSQNGTNSMKTVHRNLNSSNSLTTPSTNAIRSTYKQNITAETMTTKPNMAKSDKVTRPIKIINVKPRNVTIITVLGKNKNETVVKITKTIAEDVEKTNVTSVLKDTYTNQVTTDSPDDEEFHILTEPEHITAVMEGKEKERTSVDLISVISIAGGIMMAVITVAVIIVMVERCKRPSYEDVRKISDIRMQVMIDNNDVPPPYVRSIFHTPLPDPPTSDKCHYQPISTLDRNLKQFMRPVVVQTISPIMLENFRGILECHYDHLPRRSHNFDTMQRHYSIAPSVDDEDELTRLRPCSAMDSTIEALKCEARLDVIDSTTSEPLYAEIPCWRPPSEHAIEIMNLNGEAVTEL